MRSEVEVVYHLGLQEKMDASKHCYVIGLYGNETYILLYLETGSIIHPNRLISSCSLKGKSILM